MDTEFIKRGFLWCVSGGVLVGSIIGTLANVSVSLLYFIVLISILPTLFLFAKKEKEIGCLILCVGMGMILGLVRSGGYETGQLRAVPEGRIVVEGTVAKDPEERLGRTEYVLRDIMLHNEQEEIMDRMLVRASLGTRFAYGDRVKFAGNFEYPENFETDTGRIFDYEGYLRKEGITGIVSFAEGEYVGEGNHSKIAKNLFVVKHALILRIEQVVPVPESTLALGLLLGERGSFPQDITDAFRTAGLIHIVVLSGYNIAIIAEYTIFTLRKKFKKYAANTIAALFIVLFAILVGGGATVIRASIMGLLVLLARTSSRRYSITRALTCAIVLMVLHNPLVLTLDVSFHLSVLATLGLVYVAPVLEKYMEKIPERFGLREVVLTTLSTQIFVLPYLIYKIGEVSLVAPIANILVLPAIPFIMLLAFITGLLGIVWSGLSYLISLVLTPLLSYVLFITQAAASLPFASFTLPPISFVFMVLLYGGLVYFLWRFNQKPPVENTELLSESDEYEIVEYQIIKGN